jgi:hypothetical protein
MRSTAQPLPSLHVFENAELIPQAWLHRPTSEYLLFNPAIVRFRGQIIMCYRVVMPDGRRRLALCRLTPDFQVVPSSAVPFSDFIQNGGDWHADGRFCPFQDRLFLHYNDGARRGRTANQIYLVEVDPDQLVPLGQPRQLMVDGARQPVEKNWILFTHDNELWAIYSIAPHVVLKVTLAGAGPILCRRTYVQQWDVAAYTHRYGELRGGAPPVRLGDRYISFFHSRFVARPLRSRLLRLLGKAQMNTVHYVGGAYGFAAEPPFVPLGLSPEPLLLPPQLPRRQQQLNPEVEYSAYPCGAILQDQRWIISFGARNEYCCLTTFAAAASAALPAFMKSGDLTNGALSL